MKSPLKVIATTLLLIAVGAPIAPAHAAVTSLTLPEVIYVGETSVVLGVTMNEPEANWEKIQVEIGTASGVYDTTFSGGSFDDLTPGGETYFLISETEAALQPETTYYARFMAEGNPAVTSSEVSFTTHAVADFGITSITPTEGPVGTEVTITGKGFGALLTGGVVYFGSCSIQRTASGCGEIVSWTDTEIVAKVSGTDPAANSSATGTVGVRKELRTAGSATAYRLVNAFEGPTFTITSTATNTNQATITNSAANSNTNTTVTNTSTENANTNTSTETKRSSQVLVYILAGLVIVGVLTYMAIKLRQAKKQ